jgi:hypothetical protein
MPDLNIKKSKIWCVHNGANTDSNNCPYSVKFGFTCSIPHNDQPNGKFKNLNR